MTRTILHTRFILITSSTAGFMALPGGAERGRRGEHGRRFESRSAPAALRGAGEEPPPPRRRMPGRPRPAPAGANACAGRDHAARQAEGRSARRGGEAGQAGSRGGARPPPRQGERWSRPAAAVAAGGDAPGCLEGPPPRGALRQGRGGEGRARAVAGKAVAGSEEAATAGTPSGSARPR